MKILLPLLLLLYGQRYLRCNNIFRHQLSLYNFQISGNFKHLCSFVAFLCRIFWHPSIRKTKEKEINERRSGRCQLSV